MIIPQLKKTAIVVCALLCQNAAFAQQNNTDANPFPGNNDFRSWSIGINGGVLSQYTVFLGTPDFKTPLQSPGYGLYVKKQLVPALGLQADGFAGTLGGNIALAAPSVVSPYAKYNSEITWAASLSLNLAVVNINWRDSQNGFQLYTTLGGGLMAYKPTITDYADVNTTGASYTNIFIPVGLGLKLALSRSINLDLGYAVNFVDADNIDGYLFGSNNDRFGYSHIGLEFILGKTSKPKMSGHNALPAMRTEYVKGMNDLQKQVNTLKTQNDSIQARLDQQQAENARLATMVTKTSADVNKANADSDNDGVADKFDKCPNTPPNVKVDGSGCPLPKLILSMAERQVVDDVIQRLEFELNKTIIKSSSFASLDQLAALIIAKNAKLKIDGYTDNTGPDWRNLSLSKNRATAVKKYLIKKGVDAASITATGYGNMNPIAPNDTFEGRKQNRRVEFVLY